MMLWKKIDSWLRHSLQIRGAMQGESGGTGQLGGGGAHTQPCRTYRKDVILKQCCSDTFSLLSNANAQTNTHFKILKTVIQIFFSSICINTAGTSVPVPTLTHSYSRPLLSPRFRSNDYPFNTERRKLLQFGWNFQHDFF
jgi:hypothetical protein